MNVKLVWITPDAEKIIAKCARVSSPNPDNPNISSLLKYCIKNGHWSIYEQANVCFEIETTRAIAPQILRHRSFSFQEYSQRYSKATEYEIYVPRRQDLKNRQNSIDDISPEDQSWFMQSQQIINEMAMGLYEMALEKGIAKESARQLLTLGTKTKLYMNGSIRSWMHYLKVRCDKATQLEHREIALAIQKILMVELPIVSEALGWKNE